MGILLYAVRDYDGIISYHCSTEAPLMSNKIRTLTTQYVMHVCGQSQTAQLSLG